MAFLWICLDFVSFLFVIALAVLLTSDIMTPFGRLETALFQEKIAVLYFSDV